MRDAIVSIICGIIVEVVIVIISRINNYQFGYASSIILFWIVFGISRIILQLDRIENSIGKEK